MSRAAQWALRLTALTTAAVGLASGLWVAAQPYLSATEALASCMLVSAGACALILYVHVVTDMLRR